jgi:hypothetical protein
VSRPILEPLHIGDEPFRLDPHQAPNRQRLQFGAFDDLVGGDLSLVEKHLD